jgi:hypothetical protein
VGWVDGSVGCVFVEGKLGCEGGVRKCEAIL